MDKEKLNDIICQSSSDYIVLNNAYDYINNLEQQCKKQKKAIEKSIEYIENDLQSFLYSIEYNTLLDILQKV